MLGPSHEPAGHRRLGGPCRGLLNADPDWFQSSRVAARGQLGQHSLQRELAQQLGGGDRLVSRDRQLPAAVGGTDSGPTHPDPPAAQGHLAGLAAMTDRGPIQVMAALGADQPGNVLGKHGLQHLQAGPNRQGEQALAGGAGQLGDRDAYLLGELELGVVSPGGAVGILRHGGPLLVE